MNMENQLRKLQCTALPSGNVFWIEGESIAGFLACLEGTALELELAQALMISKKDFTDRFCPKEWTAEYRGRR